MNFEKLSQQVEILHTTTDKLQQQIDQLPHECQAPLSPLMLELKQGVNELLSDANGIQEQSLSEPLHETKAYLQTLFDNIKDYAIFTLNLEGDIASWNTGAERIFGYSEAEILGQDIEMTFTPEDRERGEPEKEIKGALENGRAEDERWHIRKDQSLFFARGVMQPMYDQARVLAGFVKIARDVTDRLRVENVEEEQRILAQALHEIAMILSGTLNLDEVLHRILDTVNRVVSYDGASILLIEGEVIARVHSRGYSKAQLDAFELMITQEQLLVEEIPPYNHIVHTHKPLLIEDLQQAHEWDNIPLTTSARAYLSVPIFAKEGVAGLLNLTGNQPNTFAPKHIDALQAFASHAGIAIRNAQLYHQGQELAALKERQQLARDLHDAVTQTLFTISLIADTLPPSLDHNREHVREQLMLLSRLARGALAEMRILLFQLRPADLLNKKLGELAHQLVTAIGARKEIAIEVRGTDEPEIPEDIHIALYRIIQEALNNVVKHSRATHASVNLKSEGGIIEIRVQDNGRGIKPQQKPSGMGLQMMRERAEAINAHLEINPVSTGGTEIRVVWPATAKVDEVATTD